MHISICLFNVFITLLLLLSAGQPINPQIYIDTAVCNVNSVPVIGVEFKPTDDLMQALSKIAVDIFVDAGAQNVNNYFTFLRFVAFFARFSHLVVCITECFALADGKFMSSLCQICHV